ncbi:MAG: D-hexose-6-phosphate mutarotase [Luteolibacter sp.]|jgi:D-hexose-6-phosphate mutarotase|nr:D-hexose-6-phosphate mutarotase [Luteolibacter sp.]
MNSPKHHEIPGRVTAIAGKGNLPALRIETDSSNAEIHLLGAHITHFQKNGGEPLLFMSAESEFEPGKPIRGGVPIIFPWFGPREGLAAHGFARLASWDLLDTIVLPEGSIRLTFRLPAEDAIAAEFRVTVGESLAMELSVTNTGASDFTFENCLHTYFQIGDIHQIDIAGLQGTRYLDSLLASEFTETGETIRFSGEVDRVYQNTAATVEIHDPSLRRTIHVRKRGSKSTVVWNPWIAKSKRMPDFGDEEYHQMVCVESGNVKANAITLAPGEQSVLKVEVDSTPLG